MHALLVRLNPLLLLLCSNLATVADLAMKLLLLNVCRVFPHLLVVRALIVLRAVNRIIVMSGLTRGVKV